MGSDTVGAKPSLRNSKVAAFQGFCKSMERAFWTRQGVRVIVNVRFQWCSQGGVPLYMAWQTCTNHHHDTV